MLANARHCVMLIDIGNDEYDGNRRGLIQVMVNGLLTQGDIRGRFACLR